VAVVVLVHGTAQEKLVVLVVVSAQEHQPAELGRRIRVTLAVMATPQQEMTEEPAVAAVLVALVKMEDCELVEMAETAFQAL